MSEYQRENGQGALFKNDRKENDKQPDYTGSIMVNGKDMRLAAWVNESKSGKKYFAIKMSEFQEKKEDGKKWDDRELNDEIPF